MCSEKKKKAFSRTKLHRTCAKLGKQAVYPAEPIQKSVMAPSAWVAFNTFPSHTNPNMKLRLAPTCAPLGVSPHNSSTSDQRLLRQSSGWCWSCSEQEQYTNPTQP